MQRLRRHFGKRPGLKATLAGAVLVTVSTTAAIVYLPWSWTSERNIEAIIAQINKEMLSGTSQEVERLFKGAQSAQQLIQSSASEDFVNLSNPEEREDFFLSVLEAHPNFSWVQFGYANGDFIGAQRTPEGLLRFHWRDWNEQEKTSTTTIDSYEVKDGTWRLADTETKAMNPPFYAPNRPWYQNAVQNDGEPAWTVYVYRSTNTPGMDGTITLETQGKTLGVIGIGIQLDQLSQYLRKLQGNRAGEAFIINQKNELIASSDLKEATPAQAADQDQPQLKNFADIQNPLLRHAHQSLKAGQLSLTNLQSVQRVHYTDPDTGDVFFISIASLGQLDWVIGTVIPEASYLGEVNRNRQILFVVIVIFTLSTAGLSIILIDRFVARPILKIAAAAAAIEAERFDADSLTQLAKRSDELGNLARIFQKMALKIYAREQDLKRQVQDLRGKISEAKQQTQGQKTLETDFLETLLSRSQALRDRSKRK